MKHVSVSPRAQLLLMFGVLAGVGAAIVTQLPEIQRYLKIRSM
jgi:hypothetical protein